ncbi:MAG: single-stranded DNA-binding protein [Bacteroidota bacterium]
MASSLNKVMLIGRLGQDSETRFTTTNQSVTSFSVATDHSYKGKDGNWVTDTTWHNVIAWNISDYMKDSLKKGKRVFVEGRITKRDYTDKEGVKRYITEIVTERVLPLDARESGGTDYNNSSADTSRDNNAPYNNGSSFNDAPSSVDNNDDLPF